MSHPRSVSVAAAVAAAWPGAAEAAVGGLNDTGSGVKRSRQEGGGEAGQQQQGAAEGGRELQLLDSGKRRRGEAGGAGAQS